MQVSDLVGKAVRPQAAAGAEGLFGRIGANCAKDPDGDPVDPHELNADNLF